MSGDAAHRPRCHLRHVRLDGGTWDVDNNVWLVGDDNEVRDRRRRAHPGPADRRRRRRPQRRSRSSALTATTTTSPPPRSLATRLHCPVLLHPGDDVLWEMTHPEETVRRLDDGHESRWRAPRSRSPHPGSLAGVVLPVRARARASCSPATPCSGRARRDRPVVLRLSHDHGLHPRPAAHAARGDPSAYRARRRHHHRRRGTPSRRMDRPRAMKP